LLRSAPLARKIIQVVVIRLEQPSPLELAFMIELGLVHLMEILDLVTVKNIGKYYGLRKQRLLKSRGD